jgi:hypothetical protein
MGELDGICGAGFEQRGLGLCHAGFGEVPDIVVRGPHEFLLGHDRLGARFLIHREWRAGLHVIG